VFYFLKKSCPVQWISLDIDLSSMERAKPRRTAILVRCTEQEAELIRDAARKERRTISGYIINAVLNRINIRARLATELDENRESGTRRGNE